MQRRQYPCKQNIAHPLTGFTIDNTLRASQEAKGIHTDTPYTSTTDHAHTLTSQRLHQEDMPPCRQKGRPSTRQNNGTDKLHPSSGPRDKDTMWFVNTTVKPHHSGGVDDGRGGVLSRQAGVNWRISSFLISHIERLTVWRSTLSLLHSHPHSQPLVLSWLLSFQSSRHRLSDRASAKSRR